MAFLGAVGRPTLPAGWRPPMQRIAPGGGAAAPSQQGLKRPVPSQGGPTAKAPRAALDVRAAAEARMEMRRREEAQRLSQASAGVNWEERVEQATNRAAEAEVDATEALDNAKQALEAGLEGEEFQQVARALNAQLVSLSELQRFVATEVLEAQQAEAPPELQAEMTALSARVRKLQAAAKQQLLQLRNSKLIKVKQAEEEQKTAEQEAREQELENLHSRQLEEIMPAAIERVDTAEDEVEKVSIAAAPLQIDAAHDLRPVMLQAIKETEQRVRAAQAAIGEARRFISSKLSVVGRFAPNTKKAAVQEFTELQTKLNDAQSKLNPYKTVRQDYEQRVQAQKLYEELSGKLAGAEIEVEKAAMMTAPLGGDSSEGIKESEAALAAAQAALSQISRLLESKLRLSEKQASPVTEEIKALQERAKIAQEKLDEVRKTVKETQVRIAADTLLREVSEKVGIAEDELQRMAEAELPFLRGEKSQDTDALIAEADKVSAKVHAALAEAQTFVARKLIEVARFSEGPARTVKEEIDMLQKRLEEGRERLTQFRASLADRKRSHLLEEVEAKVSQAESEVQKLSEAMAAINGIGNAGDAVPDGLTEALEQANSAERSSQAAIVNARAHLLQKTAELKKLAIASSGSGSELGKLQTRINTMQQEVAKMRTNIKDTEERIRVKQLLSEVNLRLQGAEADVDKVASAAVPMDDERPSAELVERMEKATSSAEKKLSTTAKLVEVKLKSAQGFLREELQGMRDRIARADLKLAEVLRSAKVQKERLMVADLLAEATEKVEKAEAELQKTSEAELPFLKGIEVLASGEALKAIIACDGLAQTAQKAIAEARTFVLQKLAEAKQLSIEVADSSSKDLMALQKRLDAGAAKLAELKKDTNERRRKTQMQASAEKVAGVEEAVQKLADVMGRFSEDKVAVLSPEEAQAVYQDIADAEQLAIAAVADARKFLALRTQDLKSAAEAQRSAQTADLSKLQSRLTQCQVELAKLSKQATEREQRFVAMKLLEESTAKVNSVEAAVQKLAAELNRLSQEKLADLSAAEATSTAEEVRAVEKEATSAVAEARKFLVSRSQQLKSLAEAQRGSQGTDLAKLQSKLTQQQVELAKLSKQVSEGVQRAASHKADGAAAEA